MRSGVVPTDGQVAALEAVIARGLVLRLFVNDHVPAVTDRFESFVEATVYGYRSASLDPTQWAYSDADGIATAGHGREVMFVFDQHDSGQKVYGWYLTQGRRLVAAWRDQEPFAIVNRGDSYGVVPVLQFGRTGGRPIDAAA
jgi:hypothetical protein